MPDSLEQVRREAEASLKLAQERRRIQNTRKVRQWVAMIYIIVLFSIAFGVVMISTGGVG